MTEWYFFGELRNSEKITPADMQEIMDYAKQRKNYLRNVPYAYILDILLG